MEAIKELYQQEINAYKEQIGELKATNKSSDEKNNILLEKVRSLKELLQKADVANKDLYTAFEHVREENLKLQSSTQDQDSNVIITQGDELALQTVQRQYVNLASESVSWISDKDRLTQRTKFLERECERYTRDNVTLGKQVRHLLKCLEEERGMIIRKSNQSNQSEKPLINASDVIDSHLVTFESIEELQKQNQKLLSLVKEMSKREEEREIQVENDDIKRLNNEIEVLKNQLDGVKSDREKIMNAFNTILKERDLFKILLSKTRQVEHLTPEIFQRMVTIACSSGPMISNLPEDTQDKDAHIVDLKAMISKLEQDLVDLRNEFDTAKLKSEEELKLKTELLEQAHLKILGEAKLAENFKEKNELLETNINSLTTVFDEARTKAQKLTFELEKLNDDKKSIEEALKEEKHKRQLDLNNIEILTKRFDEVQTRSQSLELEIEHLEREKSDLKKDMERERQENQSVFLKKILSKLNQRKPSQNALKSIREFQRLRDIERARRLRTNRKLQRLQRVKKQPQLDNSDESMKQVAKEEKQDPSDAPPAKGFVLKRRKIAQ